MLPQESYKKFAVITLYAAVCVAVIYLIFNYLWSAVLPFVIAYIFAECFRPIVKYSEKNKQFPKRFFVLFVVVLAAGSISMLIYAAARQLIREITELSGYITDALERIRTDDGYASEIADRIDSFLPFFNLHDWIMERRSNLGSELRESLMVFGEKLSGNLISFVGTAAAFFPRMVLSTVVAVIATYYFAIDRVRINCFFLSLFPKKVRPMLKSVRDLLAETVGRYLKAYGFLFLITFTELFVAFLIIGIEYSFVIALLVALVDILPVLGTGAILIPWGIISVALGDYRTGIPLIIAYAVITVVRQIIEPRIVGKFIGLPPLAALASMYIGLKLMGVFGLFVFPIGAIVVKRLLELRTECEDNKKEEAV